MVTARSRRTVASEGRLPEVQALSPDVDIVHTSAVYFIGAGGTERYLATPMGAHQQRHGSRGSRGGSEASGVRPGLRVLGG